MGKTRTKNGYSVSALLPGVHQFAGDLLEIMSIQVCAFALLQHISHFFLS